MSDSPSSTSNSTSTLEFNQTDTLDGGLVGGLGLNPKQLFKLVPSDQTVRYGQEKACYYLATPQTSNGGIPPWHCPEGNFCLSPNHQAACEPGFFCPQDTAQPLYCCGGYYCPSPDKIYQCSAGYYCPLGSIQQLRCHWFSYCPEGTEKASKTGLLLVFITLALITILLFSWKRRTEQLRIAKYHNLLLYGYPKRPATLTNTGSSLKKVEQTFDIKFEGLTKILSNGIPVMKNVSGRLGASRSCAIMGPSGAGKTTLVNLITGKTKATAGRVWVNGAEQPLRHYRKLLGFVPQEDVMLREMTVREILTHSALTRLPASWARQEKIERVLDVVKYLGLTPVMDSVVGDAENRGISGGQRKRVNIGMELVADPSVLFLDEPTSGLDSCTSLELCQSLRKLAHEQNMTVAAIVHSPSLPSFLQFDDLILLGRGGEVVYAGPLLGAAGYFERLGFKKDPEENPADFYINIASGKILPEGRPDFVVGELFLAWHHLDSVVVVSPEEEEKVGEEMEEEELEINPRFKAAFSTSPKSGKSNKVKKWILPWWKAFSSTFRDTAYWTSDLLEELKFWEFDNVRKTPNSFLLFWLLLKRATAQLYLSPRTFLKDKLLHLGCGACIGFAAQKMDYLGRQPRDICAVTPLALQPFCSQALDNLSQAGLFISLGVCYAGIGVGTSTFGLETVVYWREVAAGMPTLPYFLAKWVADALRCFFAGLVFTLAFVLFFHNRASFASLLSIITLLYACTFPMGYVVSVVFSKDSWGLVGTAFALVWAVLLSGLLPDLATINELTWLWQISAPRWCIEAFFLKEVIERPFVEVHDGTPLPHSYVLSEFEVCMRNMIFIAIAWNILAFFSLKLVNRGKQK